MANGNGSNGNGGMFGFLLPPKKFGIDQAAVVYRGMSPLVNEFGMVCRKVDNDELRCEFQGLMNKFVPTSITCAAEAQGAVVCIHEEGQARIAGCMDDILAASEAHSYYQERKRVWIDRLNRWIGAVQRAIDESRRRRDNLVAERKAEQAHYEEVMSFFNGNGVGNSAKELSQ